MPQLLKELQQRYATPGEGYGHFKLALLDKINEHFEPYAQRRQHLLDNPKEVKEILDFGASKARKIASAKMEVIRNAVGL